MVLTKNTKSFGITTAVLQERVLRQCSLDSRTAKVQEEKTESQGSAFVKDFDKRSRNLNELANERALVFVFVFVKDGQPTSACVKGYQGVSYWRVR